MKFNEFYWHEAIDRVVVIQHMIEKLLSEHPIFLEYKDLQNKIDGIQNSLFKVINEIDDLRTVYYKPEGIEHTVGSGNVFEDLGFDNPEEDEEKVNEELEKLLYGKYGK